MYSSAAGSRAASDRVNAVVSYCSRSSVLDPGDRRVSGVEPQVSSASPEVRCRSYHGSASRGIEFDVVALILDGVAK